MFIDFEALLDHFGSPFGPQMSSKSYPNRHLFQDRVPDAQKVWFWDHFGPILGRFWIDVRYIFNGFWIYFTLILSEFGIDYSIVFFVSYTFIPVIFVIETVGTRYGRGGDAVTSWWRRGGETIKYYIVYDIHIIYYITVSPPRRHQVVTKSSPRPYRVPTVSITHITGQNV